MQLSAGSVQVTYGDTTVTSNNPVSWTGVQPGALFAVQGDGVMYNVALYIQTTGQPDQIILTAPYRGATSSEALYVITEDFTPNLALPLINRGDLETATIFDVAMARIETTYTSTGDMLKAVYDVNNHGWVDHATIADSVSIGAIDNSTIKLNNSGQIYSTTSGSGGGGAPGGAPTCTLVTAVAIATTAITLQVNDASQIQLGFTLYVNGYANFKVNGVVGNQINATWLAYSGDSPNGTIMAANTAIYQVPPVGLALVPQADTYARTGLLGGLSGNVYDYVGGDGKCHNIINGLLPVGAVIWYISSVTFPGGWMACNGAAISRTTYPELYAVIGTTYGAGDGSTTFNLPDLQGRVGIGSGQGSNLSNRVMGARGGEETHVLAIGELAVHSHPISDVQHNHSQNAHNHSDAGHTHGYVDPITNQAATPGSGMYSPAGKTQTDAAAANIQPATATNIAAYTGINGTQNTGSGAAHNNMQPFLVGTYLIKVVPMGEIPLADATQAGLLAKVSGNVTDYVGGDNQCHALPAAPPVADTTTAGLVNKLSGNSSDYIGGDNQCHPVGTGGGGGTNGVNAYTTTTAPFTVPPVGQTVTVTVGDASWIVQGQMLYVGGAGGTGQAGALQVTAVAGNTITLLNPPPAPAIPLASSSQAGLLAQISGLTTDYVGGDNACHDLGSSPSIGLMRLRTFQAIGNPTMECDQISVGGTVAAANGKIIDRWQALKSGTLVVSAGQQTVAAGINLPGTSFAITRSFFRVTLTTAEPTLAAGDFLHVAQLLEGTQFRELQNDVHSVQVLVRSSVANLIIGLALRDSIATHSLTNTLTLGAANTWVLLTLPNLPLWPSAGTFNNTPGNLGYYISLVLACGSQYMSPANGTWQGGSGFVGAPGQSNFAGQAVNSTFDIAYVGHEPGALCTTPMDCPFSGANGNLEACLRYFQKTYNYATLPGTITSNGARCSALPISSALCPGPFGFYKPMAKTPTVTIYNHSTGAAGSVQDNASVNHSGAAAAAVGDAGFQVISFTTATGPGWINCHYTADTGW